MSEPAAIRATFADWRTVKGRKQLQIILEVPLEQQGDVLRMLGAPNPSDPAWVALALLQEPAKPSQEPAKDKRKWGELPPSQQAAMRCGELGFQRFIVQRLREARRPVPDDETDAERAARYVREWCCVDSRSDITTGRFTGDRWKELDDAYFGWSRGLA